jgi:hypothetical protein
MEDHTEDNEINYLLDMISVPDKQQTAIDSIKALAFDNPDKQSKVVFSKCYSNSAMTRSFFY